MKRSLKKHFMTFQTFPFQKSEKIKKNLSIKLSQTFFCSQTRHRKNKLPANWIKERKKVKKGRKKSWTKPWSNNKGGKKERKLIHYQTANKRAEWKYQFPFNYTFVIKAVKRQPTVHQKGGKKESHLFLLLLKPRQSFFLSLVFFLSFPWHFNINICPVTPVISSLLSFHNKQLIDFNMKLGDGTNKEKNFHSILEN